ncbi:DUF5719 family protein [Canibacter zhoujuaniae]|uniref:DUF5719 family protein n=1 Tax=Canibacter zhoujuaniae TaxID=2708343 RepID=UPI001421D889|nr:DUF5719 family protein [Canibacter zhoujuaniae]
MTKRTKLGQYTGRVVTGFAVTAVGVATVFALNVISLPSWEASPQPIGVDAAGNSTRLVACDGGFGQLGSDPSNPAAVTPIGSPQYVTTSSSQREIKRNIGAPESAGHTYSSSGDTPLAAAAWQQLNEPTLRGLAAHACAAPESVQWIVGGRTLGGNNSTVSITNPGDTTAVVNITGFTQAGELESTSISGLLVPAGESRSVSVNGITPGAEALALRLESTGAAVSAVLGTSALTDITPHGVDTVASQVAGSNEVLLLGVANERATAGSDAGADTAVDVQVISPGAASHATIYSLDNAGTQIALAEVDLPANTLTNTKIEVPQNSTGLLIIADTNIAAAAVGDSLRGANTDMVWYSPAPALNNGAAGAILPNGQLYLANSSAAPATVTLTATADSSKSSTVTIPARAAVTASAPDQTFTIKTDPASDGAIHAGVRIFTDSGAAAYPVLPSRSRLNELTVYTK